MPEIDLGTMSPPKGADPELVTFGPEPPDPDRSGRGQWWQSWRDRPVPRSVVAVVSAVIAGAAVAAYLGPDPERSDPATDPVQLLVPETWLEVEGDALLRPEEMGSDADRAGWRRAIADHSPEAELVLPLALHRPRLAALPPGSYLVQASCRLTEPPERAPDPVRYRINLQEPAGPSLVESTLHCDGSIGTVHEHLSLPDYAALFAEFGFIFEPVRESRGTRYFALEQAEPVVVVSFTQG